MLGLGARSRGSPSAPAPERRGRGSHPPQLAADQAQLRSI